MAVSKGSDYVKGSVGGLIAQYVGLKTFCRFESLCMLENKKTYEYEHNEKKQIEEIGKEAGDESKDVQNSSLSLSLSL